ncbi:MAG: NAD(P)-binding domain-containing protein [Polyangiales bacterium]
MIMSKRVCIIGAGPSGIAAAKNCLQAGLSVVVFEKNDKVGGNWVFNAKTGHSSVYENTHIISSKRLSEYENFPMPDVYPDYPNHRQVQAYFDAYARHFGVLPKVRFEHVVEQVTREDTGQFSVRYRDPVGNVASESFDVLMVANGHHWNPRYPEIPGEFAGKYMHSHDFKGVDESWRGKRVLVIGAGNSACDVAVESARVAGAVALSMRGPQWFLPKFVFGQPTDVFAEKTKWVPRFLKQRAMTLMMNILQGPYANYGLPENVKPVLSHHPTANSDLLDFIRHGRIKPRPGIDRFEGNTVVFSDGSREDYDIVCACTGFRISFPFFDKSVVDFEDVERVPLFRKMMHARFDNLYFIGLFQPFGCIWPLADYQAMLACAEILGLYQRPRDMAAAIQHEMEHPHYEFDGGARHSTQVDYHMFRGELKRELAKAHLDIGEPPLGKKGKYRPERVEFGASRAP